MAISFVNQANANTSGQASSLTINAPASIQAGDILICLLGMENGSSAPFTRDQTWNTAVASWFPSQTAGNGIVLWRLATASEPATYKFTSSLNPDFLSGGIAAFRGVDNVTPIDIAGTPALTCVAPSVTIVTTNAWLLFCCENDGAVTNTAPTGMTQAWSIPGSGTVEGSCLAYEGPDATGATGTRTAQTSTTGRSVLLALRPAILGGFRKPYLPQYKHRQRHQFSISQHVRIYHPKPAQYETLLVPVRVRPRKQVYCVKWKLPPLRDLKWNPLRRFGRSSFNPALFNVKAPKHYRPRWKPPRVWPRRRYRRFGAVVLASAVRPHYRINRAMSRWHHAKRVAKQFGSPQFAGRIYAPRHIRRYRGVKWLRIVRRIIGAIIAAPPPTTVIGWPNIWPPNRATNIVPSPNLKV